MTAGTSDCSVARADYAFWAAAMLTTGLSPLTLGKSGFNVARDLSVYTIAALISLAWLIAVCGRLAAERAVNAGSRSRSAGSEERAANG